MHQRVPTTVALVLGSGQENRRNLTAILAALAGGRNELAPTGLDY